MSRKTIPRKIRNSCDHLSDESYKNQSPNYCSECGIKVKQFITQAQNSKYTNMLIGYGDFFKPKLNNDCSCLGCNECIENNCQDCSACNCGNCGICNECGERINICECDPEKFGRYNKRCVIRNYVELDKSNNYIECCNDCDFENDMVGYKLPIGYKLVYSHELYCFYILYEYNYNHCGELEGFVFDKNFQEFQNKFFEKYYLSINFGA